MNSKFRETFGIIDPSTKQKYKDVLRSFLILRRITRQDLASSTVFPNPHSANSYTLHADAKVRRIINREGDCPCIVSFQTRRVGNQAVKNIAFARLYEIERIDRTAKIKTKQRQEGDSLASIESQETKQELETSSLSSQLIGETKCL